MVILQYVSLIFFFAFSAVHLYHSWKDDGENRKKTKPFLLLFLLAFYIFGTLAGDERLNRELVLALLTSWLGDVLLIPKGHVWFTVGGISFGASHIFFILVYTSHIVFQGLPLWLLIPVALLYYGIAFAVIRAVSPTTPKIMVGPMYLYLLANATMNVFALMQLLTNHSAGALIAFFGAILFFISDCTLFLVRYYKKNENLIFHKHFTVMLTYLLGEFLIVLGVMLQA